MSAFFVQTPHDGSASLFEIGTRPLDPHAWIEVDDRLAAYLSEKTRLLAECNEAVFAAEPETEAAQAEVLALLVAHLCETFPAVWRRDGDAIIVLPTGHRVVLGSSEPALVTAARLVQEDLLLMRRGETGWRLVAGALCFPSAWRLAEKLGNPLDAIHGPVPGFGRGTRAAQIVARMFDAMRPETPMLRWNWSLYGDEALFHPHDPPPRRFGATGERVVLRVERQTLRRLPASGDIVFTVRVRVDPLASLAGRPDGTRVAASLVAQIEALTPEQLAYKGLAAERDWLLATLGALAGRSLASPADP